MKMQIFYPMNAFEVIFDGYDDLDGIRWDCPISAISLLIDGWATSVSAIKSIASRYINVDAKGKATLHDTNDYRKTKQYPTIEAAIKAFCGVMLPKFRTDGVYRLIYDGGSRAGEKRLVKVTGVAKTYIDVEDGPGTRRYTISKIRDVEEVS